MPFVCTPRVVNSSTSGSPQGVALQVTDLFPHKTQSNNALYPRAKGPATFYAHGRDITATPVVDADVDIDGAVSGLAAYILAAVEFTTNDDNDAPPVAGTPMTVANAVAIADALIARMEAGQSLTITDINAAIVEELGAGNGFGEGASETEDNGLASVLQIVSGYKVFTLADNHSLGNAVNHFDSDIAALAAMFADPDDAASLWTDFSNTFYISARGGQIKKAQTRVVSGVAAPLVVVYADDGSLVQ